MAAISTNSGYKKHYIVFNHLSENLNRSFSALTELLKILHPLAKDSGGRTGSIKKK
jgi:hypothetical protein